MASKLDKLPVDIAIPPEEVETTSEKIYRIIHEILMSETTWFMIGAVILLLIFKQAFEYITRVRVRKAEARRRLEAEDEVSISEEMARLRRERSERGNAATL